MRVECKVRVVRSISPVRAIHSPEGTQVFQRSALDYWPIGTKLTSPRACVVSARCEFPGISFQWNPRYNPKCNLHSKQSALYDWPIATKRAFIYSAFVEIARCTFSEKSLQRKPRYTPEVTLFLELIAFNYWLIANKVAPFVTHAWELRSVNLVKPKYIWEGTSLSK